MTADADEGSKVSGTDKRELEEGGEESRGEEGWESDGNGEAKKEGDEGQARSISVVCPPREGDPFAARIAAHAACTRKLWRSRYLALREVGHSSSMRRNNVVPALCVLLLNTVNTVVNIIVWCACRRICISR